MNVYAVEYTYVDDAAALDETRPIHRDYLRALVPEVLVVAGAYQESEAPGALLVVRAESVEEVARALDDDPFNTAGLISNRTIRLWNPGIGSIG